MTRTSSINRFIANIRRREFGRLDREGVAYLDYTGSALHADSQVRTHLAMLGQSVLGNPHAESDPSRASTDAIEHARARVLRFLDADPDRYTVCFTANTSAAIKLVAESYPFGAGGALVLSADNHNSVNGVRQFARRAGASLHYTKLDEELRLADVRATLDLAAADSTGPRMFAFPAQSNFSGVQHPLSLIDDAHRRGFDVLLDAAAFVPSNALSLREHSPDYVALSFYKIFGYPTGVGALVVRRDALHKLRRPWFAGGTVDFVSVQNDLHQLKNLADAFEDGTPNFLSIAALDAGFAFLEQVGMQRAHDHVARLTQRLLRGLGSMSYPDGTSGMRLYGPADMTARGGTVAFNLIDVDGHALPYSLVECAARDAGIAIRGGCFCNPGAAEAAFGFDAGRTKDCLRVAASRGFTIEGFSRCLGDDTAVGAVRASVGLANNDRDIDRLIALVRELLRQQPQGVARLHRVG